MASGDRAEQRCLARAVCSDEGERLAFRDGEGDTADGMQ